MQETMKYLCENVQGCVFGYTQSDEITLILIDYQKLTSHAWFDYEVQKLCSISASAATLAFNRYFKKNIDNYLTTISEDCNRDTNYLRVLQKATERGAMFDSRCFNIPKEEVANLIYWRQLDAMRNSVQMIAQTYFSQKELNGLSCNELKRLFTTINIHWDDLPTVFKRGSACIKNQERKWFIDTEMPIIKDEGREYIEKLIQGEE